MAFRITTWNVNGIRNPFGYQPWREKRTFEAMFDILEADIVVMQETKIQRKDLRDDMVLVPGWDVFFSLPRHKKGYSGVAIYTRNSKCAPIRAEEGVTGILTSPKSSTRFRDLPQDQQIGGYPRPGQLDGTIDEATLDSEGRCVILEFPAFVLLGVYSPANRDESRDEFRLGFLQALDVRIRNLIAQGKQVILTGDLNIIRSEMDSTNVAEALRKQGLSLDEWRNMPARRMFNQLIFEGGVQSPRDEGREQPVLWDLCRCFHPGRAGMNTCWDTKRNTRPANNGSRIDYVLCSDGIKNWFTSADIQEGLMGSDHCPVFATFADKVTVGDDKERALSQVMNPPGMFQDAQRLRDWSSKDLLPLSAKLIPEFDRRQSIRDMFTKKAGGPSLSRPGSVSTDVPPNDDENRNSRSASSTVDEASESQTSVVSMPNLGLVDTASYADHSRSTKRAAEATANTTAPRSLKKSKTSTSTSDAKKKVPPGQRTLQGFFKPKASSATSPTDNEPGRVASTTTSTTTPSPTKRPTGSAKVPVSSQGPPSAPSATSTERSPSRIAITKSDTDGDPSSDRVFDPIQAKESWSRLLGKRVAPRCEHNEPCISLTTKKPGVNCGKLFPHSLICKLLCKQRCGVTASQTSGGYANARCSP
ncbi:hypothetical protein ACJZ2D_010840 [Fusarium nematophilum]